MTTPQTLSNPTQYELFNINRAKYIQDHWDELIPQISPFCGGAKPSVVEMKKCLDRFISLHERKTDDLASRPVVYRKKFDDKGRLFADHAVSLQAIARPIRHTITDGIYVDLDMVNAHPSILKQMMEADRLETRYITEYVAERDRCIAEVRDGHDLKKPEKPMSRDAAKAYFLMIINNGDDDNCEAIPEWKKKAFHSMFAANLAQEMDKAREHFATGVYADRFKEFCKYRKSKKQENHKGGWMNFLICENENRILTEIRRYFQFNENMVLVFDGAMIPVEVHDAAVKKTPEGKYDYDGLEGMIFGATGFDIQLSAKPLEFIIQDAVMAPKFVEPKYEFYNDYPQFTGSDKEMTLEKLHDWTQSSFMVVNDGGKKLVRIMKKVERMGRSHLEVKYYNVMDYDKGLKDLTSVCLVVNPKSDPEKYRKAKTKEEKKPHKPYMYETLREYIDDQQSNNKLRIYNSVEFTPFLRPEDDLTSPGAFNLFTGFPNQHKQPTPGFDFYKTRFYQMLLHNLMSANIPECEHFLDFLADAIQDGAVTKRNAQIIGTPQGGGKGLLLLWLTLVFGAMNTVCIDDIRRYFEKFNSFTTNRLIKVFEENSEGGAAYDFADRLKAEITGMNGVVEKKGDNQEKTNNCGRFILFTNHKNDVAKFNGDTRFTVHWTESPNCNNKDYFAPIWTEVNDPQFAVDCFHFLMTKKYDPKSVEGCFHTKAKDEQKIMQMWMGHKFIVEHVQTVFLNRPDWKDASKDDKMFRFPFPELNERYKEIHKGRRVDHGTLAKQLAELGIVSKSARTYNGESNGFKRCVTLHPTDIEAAIRKFIGVESFEIDMEIPDEEPTPEPKKESDDADLENEILAMELAIKHKRNKIAENRSRQLLPTI